MKRLIPRKMKITYLIPYPKAMRLNIILAQETDDEKKANRLLDDVKLTDEDFPWLDDMRLLAKCERAGKTGNHDLEADLRQQFFARQPMLFEPDNAINFNLLKYQENLKEEYQKTRQKTG